MSGLCVTYKAVRLASNDYSVPKGSIGIVMEQLDNYDPPAYSVQWVDPIGGRSTPVMDADLAYLREILIPIVVPDGYGKISEMHEPQPGVMHPVDKAFYDLVVKERDYERVVVNRLEGDLNKIREAVIETGIEEVVDGYQRGALDLVLALIDKAHER